MKLLRLVLRNARRNRIRTLLTAGGTAFLIFVLVFLMTTLTEMEAWEGEASGANRVVVQHSTGLAQPLPIALEAFLKGEDVSRHAQHVTKMNWFGGYYKEKTNQFPQFGVDIEHMQALWDEWDISDETMAALRKTKNAAIAGEELARRHGWKVGDRIVLIGQIYPFDPELELAGFVKHRKGDLRQEQQLFFRWDYFDELNGGRKMVGTYWMRARTPEDVPKLKDLIDGRTKNSSDPTETLTEKEFGQQFAEMMGGFKLLFLAVGILVILIMILMTANTMAMSARERVTEIAVLRTLGFGAGDILAMILAESVLLTVAGGAVSLGAAVLIFNVAKASPAPAFFPTFIIQSSTMAAALAVAGAAGLAAAAGPAILAARRRIVDGLRQVV